MLIEFIIFMGSSITAGKLSSPMPCIGIGSPRGSGGLGGLFGSSGGSEAPEGPLTTISKPVVWSIKYSPTLFNSSSVGLVNRTSNPGTCQLVPILYLYTVLGVFKTKRQKIMCIQAFHDPSVFLQFCDG